MRVLQRGRVYEDVVAETVDAVRTHRARATWSSASSFTSSGRRRRTTSRPTGRGSCPSTTTSRRRSSSRKTAASAPTACSRVAVELVTEHRFDGDALARSYLDLARRGHLRGAGIAALGAALDGWFERGHVPAGEELRSLSAQLPLMAASADRGYEAPSGEDSPPDYEKLVDAHNPRGGKGRGASRGRAAPK